MATPITHRSDRDERGHRAPSDALPNPVKNPLVLSASVVSLETIIAFGLAVLLALPNLRFRNVYLLVVMVPLMLSPVAVGLSWRPIPHTHLGIPHWARA